MTKQEAIEILRKHNAWKIGDEEIDMQDFIKVSEAIDFALEYFMSHAKELDKTQ